MTTGTSPELDAAARIAESIRNADAPETASTPEPTPAEAKPVESQVAEGGNEGKPNVKDDVKSEQATPPEDGKKAEGDAAKQEVKKPAEDKPENPFGMSEDELSDMLGLPKPEADSLESLRTKYANSSREAHRLVELEKARQDFFKSQGLKVVQDEEGKFHLVPDENYESKLDVTKELDIQKIYDKLSDDDKEALVTEPAKALTKIGNKIAMELLAKRPPVSGARIENRISEDQKAEVWQSFVNAKLQDGKTPRYQDADNPAVVQVMQRMLSSESPAMDKFKKVVNSDPDLNYIGLEHLYMKAKNVMLEGKIRQLLAKEQKQEQKDKLKKEVAVSAGTQIPAQGQTPVANMDAAQRIIQNIREA